MSIFITPAIVTLMWYACTRKSFEHCVPIQRQYPQHILNHSFPVDRGRSANTGTGENFNEIFNACAGIYYSWRQEVASTRNLQFDVNH